MTSPATTRYTLDPAPDTLVLAQDLLNTRGVGAQPDLLADLPSATAWLSQVIPGEVKVTATDLEQLRAFRAELHRVVTPEAAELEEEPPGRTPEAPSPMAAALSAEPSELKTSGAGTANTAPPLAPAPLAPAPLAPAPLAPSRLVPAPVAVARSAGAELVLGADGAVELRPAGGGAEYVISQVLAGVLGGQQVDSWRRLKACKNPRCQVVFYDRSRNNSGVWHSLKTCGNPANLRAFRARNKVASG